MNRKAIFKNDSAGLASRSPDRHSSSLFDDLRAEPARIRAHKSASSAFVRASFVVLVWLTLGASSANAEPVHLAMVTYGVSSWDSSSAERLLREQLERRLIPFRAASETRALLSERLVLRVDTDVDDYIRSSLDALSVGREAFFAGDYERTAELISPRLDAVEAAPEVLAFRLDFVPVLVDSFLVLAQAYDLLGREAEVVSTLERVASLFPFADLNRTQVSPQFGDEFRRARDRQQRRSIRVAWASDEPCDAYLNGSRAAVVSGGELFIPAERPVYLQFRCAGFDGIVRRVAPSVESVTWSRVFDDSLRRNATDLELQPRSSSDPEVLPGLLGAASTLLDAPVVSLARVPVGIGVPDAIEVGFMSHRGRFRAVRLSDEVVADATLFSEAIDYLVGVSSTPPRPSILWKNDPAWVALGDWSSSDVDLEADSVNRRVAGAVVGWSTIALGLVAGGAATYYAVDQRNVESDISQCTFDTCLGTSEVASMRRRVEHDRQMGTALGAVSGAAILTGTVALAVRRSRLRGRRDVELESAGITVGRRGVGVQAGVRF